MMLGKLLGSDMVVRTELFYRRYLLGIYKPTSKLGLNELPLDF